MAFQTLVRALFETQEDTQTFISSALEYGFTSFIVRESEVKSLIHLGKIALYYFRDNILYDPDNHRVGRRYSIHSSTDIVAIPDTDEIAVLQVSDWKVILLEQILATHAVTRIYLEVSSPEEANLAREIFECGCHGMVVSTSVSSLSSYLSVSQPKTVEMEPAVVSRIVPVPLSDRICIDTTSILDEDEGMLIGSSSSCLFQVCSENLQTEYTNPRPFRVNAGAVHSYIMDTPDTTKYLSELTAGTSLITRKRNGSIRVVTVGRCKGERRPMLLIEVHTSSSQTIGSIIIQNAETIRLLTPTGPRPVSLLQVHDTVLVYTGDSCGRHFGRKIKETVREQ